jgi:hypothetical protein
MKNWKKVWKERTVKRLKYYCSICLETLKEITKKVREPKFEFETSRIRIRGAEGSVIKASFFFPRLVVSRVRTPYRMCFHQSFFSAPSIKLCHSPPVS